MTSIRNFDIGNTPNRAQTRRRRPETIDEPITDFYPHSRAREGFVPGGEELAHLISRALSALSRGVFWDRGSIVNILV